MDTSKIGLDEISRRAGDPELTKPITRGGSELIIVNAALKFVTYSMGLNRAAWFNLDFNKDFYNFFRATGPLTYGEWEAAVKRLKEEEARAEQTEKKTGLAAIIEKTEEQILKVDIPFNNHLNGLRVPADSYLIEQIMKSSTFYSKNVDIRNILRGKPEFEIITRLSDNFMLIPIKGIGGEIISFIYADNAIQGSITTKNRDSIDGFLTLCASNIAGIRTKKQSELSEKALRQVCAVKYVKDESGNLIRDYVNPKALLMIIKGKRKAEDLIGKICHNDSAVIDRPKNSNGICLGCLVAKSFETGLSYTETRILPNYAKEVTAIPIINPDTGKVESVYCLERDVTEENKSKYLADLGRAGAAAAHEIRKPLATIGGFANLSGRKAGQIIVFTKEFLGQIGDYEDIINELKKRQPTKKEYHSVMENSRTGEWSVSPEIPIAEKIRKVDAFMSKLREYADLVRTNAENIDRNINIISEENGRLERLLKEARDIAKPAITSPERCDLFKECSEIIEKADEGYKDICYEIIGQNAPAYVDKDHLKSILWNLVQNAYDAMSSETEADKKQMIVRISHDEDKVYLSVNNRQVIAKETMEKLFEPFQSTKDEGTGLGLLICKKFVESNNGTMSCESTPENGTIFTVAFPLFINQEKKSVLSEIAGYLLEKSS